MALSIQPQNSVKNRIFAACYLVCLECSFLVIREPKRVSGIAQKMIFDLAISSPLAIPLDLHRILPLEANPSHVGGDTPPTTHHQPLFLQLPSTLDAGPSTCFSALPLNIND
jgi:hypothetical protein